MTPNQRIAEMNTAFGNKQGSPLHIDWTKVRNQCKNIGDEFVELMLSLGANPTRIANLASLIKAQVEFTEEPDLHGVRDALCDIAVFSGGAHHLMGIDADRDMHAVLDGVMSRFIKDEKDLSATLDKHLAKGVSNVYFEGAFPNMIMKSAADQPDAPKGKFLKSASYREPVFYDITSVMYVDKLPAIGDTELGHLSTGSQVHTSSALPSKVFSEDALKKINGTAGDMN